MITWRAGVVVSLGATWPGAAEVTVELEAPVGTATAGDTVRALAFPALVGSPEIGDRVLLNVSALARGLGTGGYALVIALPDRPPVDPPAGPGHLVKARYTPLQAMVLGVDDQESPHHELLRDADDLDGLPVVVADLHSALPAIVAGARFAAIAGRPDAAAGRVRDDRRRRAARVVLPHGRRTAVRRDGSRRASPPGSRSAATSRRSPCTPGLLAARHVVGADLVVVAQGPGNLGTGTRWGFSGVAAGEAVNAAGALGGRPVASLRVSGADAARAAPRGVAPLADGLRPGRARARRRRRPGARRRARTRGSASRRRRSAAGTGWSRWPPGPTCSRALADTPVRLSTMGRGLDQDPAAFLAAAAAGVHAVGL